MRFLIAMGVAILLSSASADARGYNYGGGSHSGSHGGHYSGGSGGSSHRGGHYSGPHGGYGRHR